MFGGDVMIVEKVTQTRLLSIFFRTRLSAIYFVLAGFKIIEITFIK